MVLSAACPRACEDTWPFRFDYQRGRWVKPSHELGKLEYHDGFGVKAECITFNCGASDKHGLWA